jgi:hypothetical protein
MRSSCFILATAVSALGGCFILPDAKAPKTGAVATGEQLAVVDDVKTWTTTSKEKVGEAVVTDANGNTVGKVDQYQEKTQVHSMKVWYPFQGNQQLSDEDFFHITNDQQAIDATAKLREDAKKWNRNGKYTMIGGAIGLIAGFAVSEAASSAAVAGELLMAAGGLALGGGWYMAYHGQQLMQPETHAVDRSEAERDAMQYNSGHQVGMGVSHSF